MDKGNVRKNVDGFDDTYSQTTVNVYGTLTTSTLSGTTLQTNSITTTDFNAGGKLTLAANTAGYTILGSNAVDGASNTRLVVSGINRSGTNAGGWIEYIATSNGDHRFYSSASSDPVATISSSGVVKATAIQTGNVALKTFYIQGTTSATANVGNFYNFPTGCLFANVVSIVGTIQIGTSWQPFNYSPSSDSQVEVSYTANFDQTLQIKPIFAATTSKPFRVVITTL